MRFPRLRFGLRTLLIITVLVAIPSAWLGKHWLRTRVQRPIVAQIRANGGDVWYDYQSDRSSFNSDKTPPGWKPLRALLGDDFFATAKVVIYGKRQPKQNLTIEFDKLDELEQLMLNCAYLPEETIAKLGSLKKLEALSLTDVSFRPAILHELANCPKLEHLSLQGQLITTDHLREIKYVTQLTGFQWVNSPLSDDGLLAICELKNLVSLDLLWSNSTPQLTAHGYAGLAQLKKLQKFQLSGPADDGIAAVANLPELKSILLWADQLTDAGLLKMTTLDQLVMLKIDSNQITDAGLSALHNKPKLEWLQLATPNITDAGLSQLSGLTNLNHLELNSPAITDAGIPSLLPLKELVVLELNEAKLTDQGLQQLSALSKLQRLTITLSPTLTNEGVKQLRTQLPDCKFLDFQSSPGGGGNISEIP